jgi:hypothetical protein
MERARLVELLRREHDAVRSDDEGRLDDDQRRGRVGEIFSPSFHGPTAATWFTSFLAAGGADSFDIVNFHGRGRGDTNVEPESFLTEYGSAETVITRASAHRPTVLG